MNQLVSAITTTSSTKQATPVLTKVPNCTSTHPKPFKNGLVETILETFSNHHHLVLRPGDIWIAITVQLSFYINANAEKPRHLFVRHEGWKELTIYLPDETMKSIDWGNFAEDIWKKLEEHVIDAELRIWIQMDFSTTTPTDRIISSVVLMDAMQTYFSSIRQARAATICVCNGLLTSQNRIFILLVGLGKDNARRGSIDQRNDTPQNARLHPLGLASRK